MVRSVFNCMDSAKVSSPIPIQATATRSQEIDIYIRATAIDSEEIGIYIQEIAACMGEIGIRRLSHPLRAQQLRLREHGLHGLLLQVRRVAVFVQDATHHHADLRPRALAKIPVDGHALLHLGD